MSLTKRRRYPNQAARRSLNFAIGGVAWPFFRTPITPTFGTDGALTVVVTLDQPVSLRGIPQYTDSANQLPTGAALTGPQQVTLTYANVSANPFNVPFQDVAIRNTGAGFVLAGTYTGA